MYATEGKRKADLHAFTSLDEWIKTLMIRIEVEELSPENLDRAVQLLNRTNQMNLATRRLSPSQLRDWAAEQNRKIWTLRVRDKLGDSGLSGVVSLEVREDRAVISDFVLSCRVIGRKVEETMLATAIDYCRSRGLSEITAGYIPTPKNAPCLAFFRNSGFEETTGHIFRWPLSEAYPAPEHIRVTTNDTARRLKNSL
jgi:FkbH-like protein